MIENLNDKLANNLIPRSQQDIEFEKFRTDNAKSGDIAHEIMDGMDALNLSSKDLARALKRSEKDVSKRSL